MTIETQIQNWVIAYKTPKERLSFLLRHCGTGDYVDYTRGTEYDPKPSPSGLVHMFEDKESLEHAMSPLLREWLIYGAKELREEDLFAVLLRLLKSINKTDNLRFFSKIEKEIDSSLIDRLEISLHRISDTGAPVETLSRVLAKARYFGEKWEAYHDDILVVEATPPRYFTNRISSLFIRLVNLI